jgi:osmotically inducible protein OsmC
MQCRASAVWDGSPIKGKGAVTTQNGALRGTHYAAQATKVGGGRTTNSAELIAAAHAASFSIALSDTLNRAGFKAERIVTTATVTSEDLRMEDWTITGILLDVVAKVPTAKLSDFIEAAVGAKTCCSIGRLLNTNVSLNARLQNSERRPREKLGQTADDSGSAQSKRTIMKEFSERKHRAKPAELLSRLKAFSWLSFGQLTGLAGELNVTNFQKNQVVLDEVDLSTGANILLSGVAKISCLNGRGERVTVALLAPGPLPEFPSQFASPWHFQCEAYTDGKLGAISWERFNAITVSAPETAFKEFHQNNSKLWYRLMMRGSDFLGLDLRERLGMTLLELCTDFGIKESRGTLLRVPFSHQDFADLIGATRPRVTQNLALLEREHLVIRQGRQLIVRVEKLETGIAVPPSRETASPQRLYA